MPMGDSCTSDRGLTYYSNVPAPQVMTLCTVPQYQSLIYFLKDGLYVLEKQSKRGRFYLLICCSSSYNNQNWVISKSGARNSIPVSHLVGDKDPRTWIIFCCLARYVSRKQDKKYSSWFSSRRSNMEYHCKQQHSCATLKRKKILIRATTWMILKPLH